MKEEVENNKITLGKTTGDIAKVMAVGQCLALRQKGLSSKGNDAWQARIT